MTSHAVTSGTGYAGASSFFSMFGFGFTEVAPGGGNHSVVIGGGANEAQRARYFVHVPSGISNYSLIYKYAVNLDHSYHSAPSMSSQFHVEVFDSASGVFLPCGQFALFDSISTSWHTRSINLSGLGGTTIVVDFSASGCGYGGHEGYAWIDMSCGLFAISTVSCDTTSLTLSAPPGPNRYAWYDSSTFSTILDTNQIAVLPFSSSPITYAVIITPDSVGCTIDTLYTRVLPSVLRYHKTNDTAVCFGTPVTISAGATDAMPLTYTWSPSATLSCSTCDTTVAMPPMVTTYLFTVTNSLGCSLTDSVRVTPTFGPFVISGSANACVGSSITLTDTAAGGSWSVSDVSLATINSSGVLNAISPGTDTVFYTVTSSCGTFSAHKIITVYPVLSPGIITGMDSVCQYDSITLSVSSSGGIWSSSNVALASVSAGGVVHAQNAGTIYVYYTVSNYCGTYAASHAVVINPAPYAGTVTGSGTSICVGATFTVVPALTGGTWVASNSAASIASGIITGIHAGVDTIFYTRSNSCGIDSFPVVVTVFVTPPSCSPNMDFEMGNTSFWRFYAGTCCPISTPTAESTHAVTSGTGTDGVYGTAGFPVVAPGGSYSAKIGSLGGGSAEKARYFVHVPSGLTNYAVIYKYAVVVRATGHASSMAPRFEVDAYDSATGSLIPCSHLTVTEQVSTHWVTKSLDLSGLGGSTIMVDFAASGCGYGGHDGWAYIDMSCGLFAISTVSCDSSAATVTAPPGYHQYAWYDSSTFAAILDTNQSTTFAFTGTTVTYAVVLTPDSGTGCPDTLYTRIVPSNLRIHPSNDTSVCYGIPVTLTTGATDIATPLTYSWSPSATLSCDTCSATIAMPGVMTTYYFSVINANGCSLSGAITVTPTSGAGIITGPSNVCVGTSIALTDTTSGGTWSSSNPSVATISSSGVVTGVSLGVDTIFYSLTGACGYVRAMRVINVLVPPIAGPITGTGTICTGTTTTLTATGTGGSWTSGSSSVATVSSAGIVTGLAGGSAVISYSVTNLCSTVVALDTITVITIPSPGSLSGAGSVCTGTSITLTPSVSGGSWTSSNSLATVSGGMVTGFSIGIDTIYYTVSGTCGSASARSVISIVTVPVAATLSGTTSMCAGTSVTLSASISGGAWSSSDTTLATVTGGVVSGLSGGMPVIFYSLTNSCGVTVSTDTVTVFYFPSAGVLSGDSTVCTGVSITITPSVSGGTWGTTSGSYGTYISGGVVTGVYAAVDTIYYAVSYSCGTDTIYKTITVYSPSSITLTSTRTCSGIDTIIASGGSGGYYTWSGPGISCTICDTNIVSISNTSTYMVNATDIHGCYAFSSITINGNRIWGHIAFAGIAPDTLDTKVWLIQFDPSDSSITGLDSTYTCLDGGIPFYEFDGWPTGNYLAKAQLIYGNTPGASGYLPTYADSTQYWYTGTTAAHTGGTDTLNVNMTYGTVPSGPGFISGYVYSGAGKGTTGDVPVQGMTVFLRNAAGKVLTYVYTDASGYYSFGGLGYAVYTVFPTDFSYYTIPSANITLSAANEIVTNVNFKQHTTLGTITPYDRTSIQNTPNDKGVSVYPNPATGMLYVEWPGKFTADAVLTLTDVAGRVVSTNNWKSKNVPARLKVDVSTLVPGTYLVNFKSGEINYVGVVVKD